MNSEELKHYGIKGQKWGVRRFQEEDGSLTPAGKERYYVESDKKEIKNDEKSSTVPKGYKFNRIGQANLDINKSGALYVSSGKADVTRYMRALGPTPIGKLMGQYGTTIQHITVKEDLKKASTNEMMKTSSELLLSNPKLRNEINNSMFAGSVGIEINEASLKEAINNPKSKTAAKIAYATSAILADPNYVNEAKQVYSFYRDKGYDAIPDLNDILTGTSETATIVINPSKLEVTSKTTITKDLMKEGKKYLKTLEKLKTSELLER